MGKRPLKDIPRRDNIKPYLLKADYAAGEVEPSIIHAYNYIDAERKRQYHHDATEYLRRVGIHLRHYGCAQMSVASNKGGIAVGGEIYATYSYGEGKRSLSVTIETNFFEWASPRWDTISIRAQWHEPDQEKVKGASRHLSDEELLRFKAGKPIASYEHRRPSVGPVCRLNPNYDSEITARCLSCVLQATREIAYWEWLPDGSLMTREQAETEWLRRREMRAKERAARGRWEPIRSNEWGEEHLLRDTYLAARNFRLLFDDTKMAGASSRGLEQPRFSRPGEEVFLQRDFERDAQHFLHALGSCLARYGYIEMRIEEYETIMMTSGDYRRALGEQLLRVKLGSVRNTDVAQRHDHLVIAVYLASPDAGKGDKEEELCILQDVPINLSPASFAQKMVALANLFERSHILPKEASPAPTSPGQKRPRMRVRDTAPNEEACTQLPLF